MAGIYQDFSQSLRRSPSPPPTTYNPRNYEPSPPRKASTAPPRRRKTLAPGEEPKRRLELPGLELDLTGNNFDYEKELAKDEERPRPQPANQKHREAVQRLYAEAVANRRKAMERLQMAPESFLSQQAPSLLGRAAAVDVRPSDALFRISLDDGSATPRTWARRPKARRLVRHLGSCRARPRLSRVPSTAS